jgi:CDP-glucose 4,6-dehydratase
MENVVTTPHFWKGRRVLVTGHTGFKGAWLSLWLHRLGAAVHGLALDPPTSPSLFEIAKVSTALTSDNRVDIRNQEATRAVFERVQPEAVFHLAAQTLVRKSYREPIDTYAVNVMGTAHILEAVRSIESVRAVIVVTTDKCYANREWVHPYRETDELGGFDPYSSSKACAELVTSAFRSSYLNAVRTATATARAGNVIGGGDWAEERLLPDCVRAHFSGGTLRLRFPDAVRPWQHVLEPLAGYLRLAEALLGDGAQGYSEAWNFGPDSGDTTSVREVAALVSAIWKGSVECAGAPPAHHEAGLLQLDSTKARLRLAWRPRWALQRAVENTLAWYTAWSQGVDMLHFSFQQIADYEHAEKA